MIKVEKYEPRHLESITPKEIHQGEVPKVAMNSAITLLLDEEVIAILGGFIWVPGVMHVWAIMSESIRKKPLDFHKRCLDILDFYEKHEKLRRIQVEVKVAYLEGQRWIESLGFEREGIMRAYGQDGSDHYLYARVKWQP